MQGGTIKDKALEKIGQKLLDKGRVNKFNKKFQKTKSISSSIKFIEISNASSDLYSRFEGASAWDTSAGQAIIESHGGLVLSLDTKKRLKYESKSRLRNPPFIALRKNLRLYSFNKKVSNLKIDCDDILVVAPYNMQVELLKSVLPEGSKVGTIDKFQGDRSTTIFGNYKKDNPKNKWGSAFKVSKFFLEKSRF